MVKMKDFILDSKWGRNNVPLMPIDRTPMGLNKFLSAITGIKTRYTYTAGVKADYL